jgi:hypothetical protein
MRALENLTRATKLNSIRTLILRRLAWAALMQFECQSPLVKLTHVSMDGSSFWPSTNEETNNMPRLAHAANVRRPRLRRVRKLRAIRKARPRLVARILHSMKPRRAARIMRAMRAMRPRRAARVLRAMKAVRPKRTGSVVRAMRIQARATR